MEKPYHIVGKESSEELGSYLAKNGQVLLPMVELIEQSKMAVDELIDVLGRAQIEAVLRLSAEGVAGPPHPGKKSGAIGRHGREIGTVCLKERKLRVKWGLRPLLPGPSSAAAAASHLRSDSVGPAVEQPDAGDFAARGVDATVSSRTAGDGGDGWRLGVECEPIEASEEELKRLCERRLEELDLLIIYLDGVIFGDHHVLVVVGVDAEGHKHVLGVAEGARENQSVAKELLEERIGNTCL